MPWWLQSYVRDWPGNDGGMFGAKQTTLASTALYRYWNMVGVLWDTRCSRTIRL